MYNFKQKLGIKWNIFKSVIYVTYNKTSNKMIMYTRQQLNDMTFHMINGNWIRSGK